MKKFKELLFLNNLKGLGKIGINKKYLDSVEESENYSNFISSYTITSNFS